MYKTFQYRIKDSNNHLRNTIAEMGFAVNRIWNNANELQIKALRTEDAKWPSGFDLNNETAGWGNPLNIHSDTVQETNQQYVKSRTQFKKPYLKWRSNRKSLTWIPFKKRAIRVNAETGKTKYFGLEFNVWYSRPYQGEIKTGSITADSRGRLYLNLVCKLPDFEGSREDSFVGIDLGLKQLAVMSDGRKVAAQRFFRKQERKIAYYQRKGMKKQVRKTHKQIQNQRKDFNHKLSKEITDSYKYIFVGDVSSSKLAETKMAKSVYDAGWFQLKSFLSYKALAKGGLTLIVNESYSTQICSACGCIPSSSPKGTKGLEVREWTCSECHAKHDRDINAAMNILSSGHRTLQRMQTASSGNLQA